MSRRRRQNNRLLGRILLISVLVHLIVVPILARFGVFEKVSRRFMVATVNVAPPPPALRDKLADKMTDQRKSVAKAKGQSRSKSAQARSEAPHPPVIASAGGSGDGLDAGPVINPNGTGRAGEVPVAPRQPGATTNAGPGNGGNAAQAEPKPEPKPDVKPVTKPEIVAVSKPAVAPSTVLAHIAVLVAAEPTYQPQPAIPDDLRSEALDKTCVLDIAVAADGTASAVTVGSSCGSDELDDIAVKTAKKWRFRPATRDGEAIGGRVRLHIQFKVE
jgi:protein TonB